MESGTAIVVDEGDQFPPGFQNAAVPGSGDAGNWFDCVLDAGIMPDGLPVESSAGALSTTRISAAEHFCRP